MIRRGAVLEAIQEVCTHRGYEPNRKQHVSAAVQYVIAEQGDAMSVFESHEL